MNFKKHKNKSIYGQTSNIHFLQIFLIIHLELFTFKFEYFLRNHIHKSENLKRKNTLIKCIFTKIKMS